MKRRISSGSTFEQLAGYSRAVVAGDTVYVSGTTGFDYATMRIDPDVAAQTRQTFANLAQALAGAGASLDDVVRVRVFLAERESFALVAPILGEMFARARPANTTVVTPLVDPRMRVEIEVEARLGA